MAYREDLKPERLAPIEEEILATWAREKTFERVLEARRAEAARDPSKRWVFYDGPPTANGKPGIHHLISRSIKDFACRLQTMKGRLVERKAGWDTHGLPVEVEAEKKLGLQGKDAIEKMGIAAFNAACRESVFTYLAEWRAFTERSGYWLDLDAAYVTCSNEYVESLWAILADFHRRGLLVKGHKVLPYCPRCGTALSSHEVGQGFKDVQDPSVVVRFRAVADDGSDLPESFLVWTTTPWTLPSNVALAVHPDVDYVKVRVKHADLLWLAKERVPELRLPPEDVEVVERRKGSELVGRRFHRLFDWYDVESTANAFTVRPATFVTTEEGTGIVHMAPAYGEDDARVGRRDALPTLHPIDAKGRFLPSPRAGAVAGMFVKDADKVVLRALKEQGLLFRQETLVHSYPHCWRCDTPLLYYARDSWYLKTTQFRDDMLRANAAVAWYPPATGAGRLGQWLENNVDWAISRERYWGTPLPVWVCDACKGQEAIGSIAELRARVETLPEPIDLHRPWVDERTWRCAKPGCRGTMRRTPEVADCWFDSGSMPFAQWHYPFENKERVEREHPAQFIAEGVDQTRGWFYTLLAVSVMYRKGKDPLGRAYESCVSNDLVLDARGKKMSKKLGNVVDPMALMSKFGADVARWFLLTSRPVWLPVRFDERDVEEVRNRLFRSLASTCSFFALYANADGFAERTPPPRWAPKDVFDRWLLSRLSRLVADVSADLADYETSHAGKRITDFVVEDLSNWYVRRNRRRFWKGALTDDKRDGYRTLREALLVVSRLMAPLAPFLPDAIHRALSGEEGVLGSVHFALWPEADASAIDDALEAKMDLVRRIVSVGHAARQKAGTKVRTPVRSASVHLPAAADATVLSEFADVIREELNLLAAPARGEGALQGLGVSLDKKVAAPVLGARTVPVAAAVERLLAEDVERRLFEGQPVVVSLSDGERVELPSGFVTISLAGPAAKDAAYDRGVGVRLDTTRTPEVVRLSLVREFVHALQALRKSKGLKVTDRVRLRWSAKGDLAAAIREHAAYVREEILAVDVREEARLADGVEVEVEAEKALVTLEVVSG